MTLIRFYVRRGRYCGYEARGHAGYGRHGKDIVCAAISALTQTTVLSLARLPGVSPQILEREKTATLRVAVPEAYGMAACRIHDLIASLRLGLSELERQYPGYVRVLDTASPRRRQTPGIPDRRSL